MLKKFLIFIISLNSTTSCSSIFNSKSEISLPRNIKLTLERYDQEYLPVGAGWKNKLIIKENDKIKRVIKPPINHDQDHGLAHYFVPIKKKKYFYDLNKDGNLEIAIIATSQGNAMFVPAFIYSLVGDNLVFYKEANYSQEGKLPIVFGCYKCTRWNMESSVCQKCFKQLDELD